MGDEADPSSRSSRPLTDPENGNLNYRCIIGDRRVRDATRGYISTIQIPMEPHWLLPAQLSIENIETHSKCWGIVAAGRSSKASDLKVEVHTDEEFGLFDFLDMVESDDEAMVDRARLAALNQAWKDRQQHLMQEINSGKLLPPEQTDCEDEDKYCDGAALEINAKLANWWHHMRDTEAEEQEKTDEQGGESQKLEVAMAS